MIFHSGEKRYCQAIRIIADIVNAIGKLSRNLSPSRIFFNYLAFSTASGGKKVDKIKR